MTVQRICVLGNNACAWEIADRLSLAQMDVILAAVDEARDPRPQGIRADAALRVKRLSGVRLAACSGQLGRFELAFERQGAILRQTVSAIVLAESDERRPNETLYGLKPAKTIVPLSTFLNSGGLLPVHLSSCKQIVFLNGLRRESHPSLAGDVMRAALQLQSEHGLQCCILTRNLKVAGEGLEALSREARSAGVLFFKFANGGPEMIQGEDGAVRVRFVDDPTGKTFGLDPDLVVVDETVRPSTYAVELGHVLGIESDPEGFVQGDNVHRLPAATNRRGIIVAGPARIVGPDPTVEASNAAMEVLVELAATATGDATAAVIETGRCIRCLTCLRVCPYGALVLDGRPQVLPAACERCGICAAECPREAIRMVGLERGDVRRFVSAGPPADSARNGPHIVAFCCRRSAGPALRAAVHAGGRWPATLNIIEVPCAGSLSLEAILSAFRLGADGVLVLACHADNCHSCHGNHFARRRTELAATFLERFGPGADRLVFKTLASNMPAEMADIVTGFSQTLAGLGGEPRPLER